MLANLENLPKEHILKKYAELTGKPLYQVIIQAKGLGFMEIEEYVKDYYELKEEYGNKEAKKSRN